MNASQAIEALNCYTEKKIEELKADIPDPRMLSEALKRVVSIERQCIEQISGFEKQLERSKP